MGFNSGFKGLIYVQLPAVSPQVLSRCTAERITLRHNLLLHEAVYYLITNKPNVYMYKTGERLQF